MDIVIEPRKLSGKLNIIPSKSQAHRLLICAAFADKPTSLLCSETNRDMETTADCLRALGAGILQSEQGYEVTPVKHIPQSAVVNCRDSGSTLRFLLPVVGALGVDTTFHMEGRLPHRPLSPLWEEMERMGCILSRPTEPTLRCQGRLQSGNFSIDGGVSSQFITGLLLALSLLPGKSRLNITGKIESRPYIDMTRKALALFGVDADDLGGQIVRSPGQLQVEGDWSGAAFFLAANALGSDCLVEGLDRASIQGDRAIETLVLKLCEGRAEIDGADIPDLIPILSVVAACKHGALFTHIERLQLKESNRIETICQMLKELGCRAEYGKNGLEVFPCVLTGGTVDACNDHRIAMSAAIAATAAKGPVTILGAQCAEKSYPRFWAEYARLGGNYEQYLR